ncbi:glycerol kinase [Thermotoga sp. Ku-13t]|uniref:glycerol kinase GlpK n=1 Tax=Thermotoga sp. Ku-13t TaxID=1755813 RepID=UPI0013EB1D4A|nr:glycerol kinase GlpK [Thermotoga sp. Ku-13t]KAF2958337.1 glycerol kinase [Thermotoga sp. Ku-13t]
MEKRYVLALDQGTTSSRAILFDSQGNMVGMVNQEFPQIYPRPGWVEHDPYDILESQVSVVKKLLRNLNVEPQQIAAIGITNQRETTIVWDKKTGKPVYNAIVWQCRRTAGMCDEIKAQGLTDVIRSKTGLVVDAYFSATKIQWILKNVPGMMEKAKRGEIAFGTVDSWLIWNLTGGKVHATDVSNASRTMLFNINDLCWDEELLDMFGVPRSVLPEVCPSSYVYGVTEKEIFGVEIPIAADIGDQQAALFGQMCVHPGTMKNTYGTGCFILMNIGNKPVFSRSGLLTTVAWKVKDEVSYALEGSVFIAGAAIQWLRNELRMIESAAETEQLALSVPDSAGVYFVPAFVGLGAPHWDMYARGAMFGLTRGARKEHIVRAVLESIAYQTRDVVEVMCEECGTQLKTLRVDGGASKNNFLMQFQADILNVPVERPRVNETTALGAAYLAGLAVGYWENLSQIESQWQLDRRFVPSMDEERREELYRGWKKAVERAKGWLKV